MPSINDVATRFVDLVRKYRWVEVENLPADEVKVLYDTVSVAGFNLKEVVLGRVTGRIRDQDREIVGTFKVNPLCPFKVIDDKDRDHDFATGWLNCLLERVVFDQERLDGLQLIETTVKEIERSVPMKPIRLTGDGDYLCESSPQSLPSSTSIYLVDHKRDEDHLGSCVGVHKRCEGFMERKPSTASDVIRCLNCGLRVVIPMEVQTYGELRRALMSS